jgi:mRNA interferase HigB
VLARFATLQYTKLIGESCATTTIDPILGTLRYNAFMHVISVKTLRQFWEQHAAAEETIKNWYHFVDKASWKSPVDVKRDFPSASILPGNRAVFNLKGNQYRLVVRVNYNVQIVYVRFVGTHAEYNRIDATQV